jgi:hypothetical protein
MWLEQAGEARGFECVDEGSRANGALARCCRRPTKNNVAPTSLIFAAQPDDDVVGLGTAHCLRRRGDGVLHSPSVPQLHRKGAPQLLNVGLLELVALRLSAELVALAHVLVHRSSALYLTGIEPRFARLSLGALLVAKTMQRAIVRRHTRFDFLRGGEPYKYEFGAKDTLTYRAELRSSTARAHA